jgi:hypothetical protein
MKRNLLKIIIFSILFLYLSALFFSCDGASKPVEKDKEDYEISTENLIGTWKTDTFNYDVIMYNEENFTVKIASYIKITENNIYHIYELKTKALTVPEKALLSNRWHNDYGIYFNNEGTAAELLDYEIDEYEKNIINTWNSNTDGTVISYHGTLSENQKYLTLEPVENGTNITYSKVDRTFNDNIYIYEPTVGSGNAWYSEEMQVNQPKQIDLRYIYPGYYNINLEANTTYYIYTQDPDRLNFTIGISDTTEFTIGTFFSAEEWLNISHSNTLYDYTIRTFTSVTSGDYNIMFQGSSSTGSYIGQQPTLTVSTELPEVNATNIAVNGTATQAFLGERELHRFKAELTAGKEYYLYNYSIDFKGCWVSIYDKGGSSIYTEEVPVNLTSVIAHRPQHFTASETGTYYLALDCFWPYDDIIPEKVELSLSDSYPENCTEFTGSPIPFDSDIKQIKFTPDPSTTYYIHTKTACSYTASIFLNGLNNTYEKFTGKDTPDYQMTYNTITSNESGDTIYFYINGNNDNENNEISISKEIPFNYISCTVDTTYTISETKKILLHLKGTSSTTYYIYSIDSSEPFTVISKIYKNGLDGEYICLFHNGYSANDNIISLVSFTSNTEADDIWICIDGLKAGESVIISETDPR